MSRGGGLYINVPIETQGEQAPTLRTEYWNYEYGTTISISNSLIAGNSALCGNAGSCSGGGIVLGSGGSAVLRNVTVADNFAPQIGGGFSITGITGVHLYDCVIERNRANVAGGQLFSNSRGDVAMTRSNISMSLVHSQVGHDVHCSCVIASSSWSRCSAGMQSWEVTLAFGFVVVAGCASTVWSHRLRGIVDAVPGRLQFRGLVQVQELSLDLFSGQHINEYWFLFVCMWLPAGAGSGLYGPGAYPASCQFCSEINLAPHVLVSTLQFQCVTCTDSYMLQTGMSDGTPGKCSCVLTSRLVADVCEARW